MRRNECCRIVSPRKLECTLQIDLLSFDRFPRRYFARPVSDLFSSGQYNPAGTANWRVRERYTVIRGRVLSVCSCRFSHSQVYDGNPLLTRVRHYPLPVLVNNDWAIYEGQRRRLKTCGDSECGRGGRQREKFIRTEVHTPWKNRNIKFNLLFVNVVPKNFVKTKHVYIAVSI